MTLLAALGLGLLIGLVIGALGGGGSVLTVPVLVFVLGLSAQDATTASLVIVGITSAVAAVGHARSGHTRWRAGVVLALAGLPASLLGTVLNRRVDGDVLLLAFAGLLLVAATGMLVRRRGGDAASSPDEPSPPTAETTRHWSRLAGAGLLIGFLTGFFGVGGGFVVVPALVLALHFPMSAAVGTSLFVIALNAVVALGARAGTGSFEWGVIVPFTLAAVVASFAGTKIAGRLPAHQLTQGFGVLLLVVAGYVGVRAGLALW